MGANERAGGIHAPVVVCSVLARDVDAAARAIEAVPPTCGLIEIRGDHLCGEDLASLAGRLGPRAVATVRRPAEGGAWRGSEEERERALLGALRAGAGFVDVEYGSSLEGLARGEHSGRTILSHHGGPCTTAALEPLYAAMAAVSAGRLKIVPEAASPAELPALPALLRLAGGQGRALSCFALGRAGALSRLLGPSWGSWATYGSAHPGAETAPGQFSVRDLLETYGVLEIAPATRRFALIGSAVFRSPSPAMHRAAFRAVGLDAVYLPVELDALEECLPLLGSGGAAGIEGLAVTMPFKQEAARRCRCEDASARASGAVNTVRLGADAWSGYNTDGPAALALVRDHVEPRGAHVAVVGAGGTARAVAAALCAAGARVTLFNRGTERGERAARQVGVAFRKLDQLAAARWDVLVQATPLGAAGESVVPAEALGGRMVLDAVYGPETPLIAAARSRGLAAVDGFALLTAQAVLQWERLTGAAAPPAETFAAAGRSWLAARTASAT